MTKKKIDESLLIEMAAKGFPKRSKPQTVTPKEAPPVTTGTGTTTDKNKETVPITVASSVTPIQTIQEAATYKAVFFKDAVYTDRITQALNRETLALLKAVITYTDARISVAAFVDNILRQHLVEYRDLLNELTAPNIPRQVIPKL